MRALTIIHVNGKVIHVNGKVIHFLKYLVGGLPRLFTLSDVRPNMFL